MGFYHDSSLFRGNLTSSFIRTEIIIIIIIVIFCQGWGNVVGITPSYGLEGPGIDPQWG
jgi:hypothetical protein